MERCNRTAPCLVTLEPHRLRGIGPACELMFVSTVAATSEGGSGLAPALVWLAIALGLLAVIGSLAYLIGRDANRRGRNGLVWGLLFVWQAVIVGMFFEKPLMRWVKRPTTSSS